MPRLKCTFEEARIILEKHGFTLIRQKGSHRYYRGEVGGKVCLVTLAPHNWGDEILPDTLASIIRQSSLPKSLFRK